MKAASDGRIISGTIRYRLTPPQEGVVFGDTDAAWEIGQAILREMLMLLVTLAEKEGFTVEVHRDQIVY